MTPEEAVVYYDDPAHAAFMCDVLMRARPGWTVQRGKDRVWRARRDDWPAVCRPLADWNAGLLNLAMAYMDGGDAA